MKNIKLSFIALAVGTCCNLYSADYVPLENEVLTLEENQLLADLETLELFELLERYQPHANNNQTLPESTTSNALTNLDQRVFNTLTPDNIRIVKGFSAWYPNQNIMAQFRQLLRNYVQASFKVKQDALLKPSKVHLLAFSKWKNKRNKDLMEATRIVEDMESFISHYKKAYINSKFENDNIAAHVKQLERTITANKQNFSPDMVNTAWSSDIKHFLTPEYEQDLIQLWKELNNNWYYDIDRYSGLSGWERAK